VCIDILTCSEAIRQLAQVEGYGVKGTLGEMSSLKLLASSTLLSQGAEAKVYKGYLAEGYPPIVFKYRFKKQYRHPSLDGSLTRSRIAGEARALIRCLRSGVNVPGIRMVDAAEGIIGIEWIRGNSVRNLLTGDPGGGEEPDQVLMDEENPLLEYGITVDTLMNYIGNELAKMHLADIIHGDLTTSNMMLRHPSSTVNSKTQLVLIDFGLSYQSNLTEDKAVDLYVLERAFSSTHPDSELLFASVLASYATHLGKEWPALKRKLDDVRLRGRKRSMVG